MQQLILERNAWEVLLSVNVDSIIIEMTATV